MRYYIVSYKGKYLHLNVELDASWGGKDGAFRFFSRELATEFALTTCPDEAFKVHEIVKED